MSEAIVNIIKQGQVGACREFWVKITESDGSPLCGGAVVTTYEYYVLNPFGEPVVITEALINIITEDADDGDMDIGLADDAAGTNSGTEIIDSLVNSAAVVKRGLLPLDGVGVAAPVWREEGYPTDSYLTVYHTSANDCAALEYVILLKCIPLADLS